MFVLGAASARAEDEHARARLERVAAPGAESCMGKRELEAAVEARLNRDVFSDPPALVVEVRLAKKESGYRAELALTDAQGHELGRRELVSRAGDCSALDASLALVVALLVDSPPEAPPSAAPAPTPEKPPSPPPPPTPIALPKDTFAPRAPWRFAPTLSASGAVGRLPGFALGARAGVGFLPPRFPEFRLSVGGLLPKEEMLDGQPYGARFSLVDAMVELCPLEHAGTAVRLSACLGQSIGSLAVTGIGFDRNDTASSLDAVLTAGIASWFYLAPPLGIRLGLSAGFPLSRNSYGAPTPGGRVVVWQRGYVLGSGELGVGLEL
jgi:hypothetical protein